ncbi:MAG: hypothetical protein QMB94_14930 [Phycisphaerales bacterium]
MKNRNTSILTAIASIALVAAFGVSTAAAATPPKGGDGKETKPAEGVPASATDRPVAIRAGISEAIWFDALRQVRVTDQQREFITPLVRGYLAKSKAWRAKEGVELMELTKGIKRVREEGGVVAPEIIVKIRSLRSKLPSILMVQNAVKAQLTTVEQDFLSAKIVELRRAEEARVRAERITRSAPVKGTPASSDEIQSAPQESKEKPPVGGAEQDDPKKAPKDPAVKNELPWSFVD